MTVGDGTQADLVREAGKPGLPNIRQPNLKSRVFELLLNMIIDGKYRDNDMLPPERLLCEELGVSRTVIREAIKSLESRGVLSVIHGKGIKVLPTTSSDISNAFMLYLRRRHREVSPRDLMEMRFSIETEIAAVAAQRATEADIRELGENLVRMRNAVRVPDQYIRADLDFHVSLASATHNILFITILESLLIPLRRSFEQIVELQDPECSCQEHARIHERVAARDSAGARQLMAQHLEKTRQRLERRGKL
jgi:GntR family transcriptional repressor for pyruvate dehydrogenase complex